MVGAAFQRDAKAFSEFSRHVFRVRETAPVVVAGRAMHRRSAAAAGLWLGPELVCLQGLVEVLEGPYVYAVLGSEGALAAIDEDAAGQAI